MLLKLSYSVCSTCPNLEQDEHPGGRIYHKCKLSHSYTGQRPKIFFTKRKTQKIHRVVWEGELELPENCPFRLDYIMLNAERLEKELNIQSAKEDTL